MRGQGLVCQSMPHRGPAHRLLVDGMQGGLSPSLPPAEANLHWLPRLPWWIAPTTPRVFFFGQVLCGRLTARPPAPLSANGMCTYQHNTGRPLQVHRGMMASAQTVYGDLTRLDHEAHEAFEGALARYPDYELLVMGHSLGAGTAALLSLMLYPRLLGRLRCIAYSPPGGLMSQEAAEFTQPFVTSVMLGDDVVPRLGIHSLVQLRERLLPALAACKRHKWQVAVRNCRNVRLGSNT